MKTTLAAVPLLLVLGCQHPPAQRAAPASPTSPTVAMIGSRAITLEEVEREAAQNLYELRERTLDGMINERVVAEAAKQAKLSDEEFLRKRVEEKVPPVSAEEARAFYESNQERLVPELRGQDFSKVQDRIIQGLTRQRRSEAVKEVIAELRKQAGVKVLLEPPRIVVEAKGPSRGPANAKVTIVEFSDFQCPYCSKARDVLEEVMRAYQGKVRLVYRDFPLSFHQNAAKAAEAGRCADEQGKFWEMHDWMFDHQDALSVQELEQRAKDLGLDPRRFAQCLTSGKYVAQVEEDVAAGKKAGVTGTPTIFINGVLVSGLQSFEELKPQIDAALAR